MIDRIIQFLTKQLNWLLCLFMMYCKGASDEKLKILDKQNTVLQKQLEIANSDNLTRTDIIDRMRRKEL